MSLTASQRAIRGKISAAGECYQPAGAHRQSAVSPGSELPEVDKIQTQMLEN